MTDTTDPANTLPLPRYTIVLSEWRIFSRNVELKTRLRLRLLRYPKLGHDHIKQIMFEAMSNSVKEEDACYGKTYEKIQGNMATWKHETIEAMKVRVRSCCAQTRLTDLVIKRHVEDVKLHHPALRYIMDRDDCLNRTYFSNLTLSPSLVVSLSC